MFQKWTLDKKKKPSSIFMVILWINIGSIVVLTFFNYQVFHRMGNKAYKESFISYNQRVLDLAFENIDKQIMQSVFRIGQLNFPITGEDAPLFAPQTKPLIGSSERTIAFADEMRQLQRTYPYIASLDIYYEGTKSIVTGFDKVHVLSDIESLKLYLPWYGDYVTRGRKSGFVFRQDGAYLVDGATITYIRKISKSKWNGKDIVLAFHILPSRFAEYIDVESGCLTIVGDDNQILYTTKPENLPMFEDEDLALMRNEDTPIFLKYKKEPVTVFRKGTSTSGLMYLYSIQDRVFYKDYNVTTHMLLINFFVSIGLNIFVLALISFYNYKTYRGRILAASMNAGIEIGSLEHGFDAPLTMLTKEITTLHDEVNSSKGLLFQNAVRAAVMNRKTEGTYELLSPYLTYDSFCVFFVKEPGEDKRYVSVEDLQEEFPAYEGKYHVLFTVIEKDGLVAIINSLQKHIKQDIDDFKKNLEARFPGCCIVYGKVFTNQKDGLKNSYKSTVEIFRYHYIFPERQILCEAELNLERRKETGSHLKLFEAMSKDIKNENLLDFKTHMEFLITSIKNGIYGIDYCMSTLRDLVTLMYQVIQHNQLDMWVVFGYDIREYYRQITDIDTYHGWMNGLGEVILKNIRQRQEDIGADVKTRVVQMIEEHLEGDISLDFIAEQLNIRPDVASRLFRQMMGCGYTEYVKEKKLCRAIKLLEQDYSVKDIAHKLGYSSPQYFIKVFKEEKGITPHQYKKNNCGE